MGISIRQTGRIVSILVFLDMEFRHMTSGQRYLEKKVSILVFLDMEFRPDHLEQSSDHDLCFNPCFSGYGIQT